MGPSNADCTNPTRTPLLTGYVVLLFMCSSLSAGTPVAQKCGLSLLEMDRVCLALLYRKKQ